MDDENDGCRQKYASCFAHAPKASFCAWTARIRFTYQWRHFGRFHARAAGGVAMIVQGVNTVVDLGGSAWILQKCVTRLPRSVCCRSGSTGVHLLAQCSLW